MASQENFIDLKPIQIMTPEQSMLSYSWLVTPDDKYPPARWKTDVIIPAEYALDIEKTLDAYWKAFTDKLKAAFPEKTKDDYKFNDLPWKWGEYPDLGLDNAFILKTNKKTEGPDGRKKPAPIMFDRDSYPTPLNDDQKQKYDKIGPGTTAQVGIYVSQYHMGVGTGIRLTPAAINIKNFKPFGKGQSVESWGFTGEKKAATPTPGDEFDF
jgi:hypothetical protein|tara:strand:+ start:827 stop:1459 length:633 start_codon:yes stop_codon:yes gene_type:complete